MPKLEGLYHGTHHEAFCSAVVCIVISYGILAIIDILVYSELMEKHA